MNTEERKKRKEREELLQKALTSFSKDVKIQQADEFLQILKEYHFFDNFSKGDLLNMYSGGDYWLNFCRNKVRIMIVAEKGNAKIGIDPSFCYDKLNKSSILAQFPMKKREYERFIQFFRKILDRKSPLHKNWMRYAPECFYGQYATFGM